MESLDNPLEMTSPDLEAEGEVGLIEGQRANSREEWRVANALWKLKFDFSFQVPVAGGRRFRGGFVLDFLVDTVPSPTPINVNGRYWHKGLMSPDERFKVIQLDFLCREEFGSGPLVELWGEDLQNMDMAFEHVRAVLLGKE